MALTDVAWTPAASVVSSSGEFGFAANGRTMVYARYNGAGSIVCATSTDEGRTFAGEVSIVAGLTGGDVPLDRVLVYDLVTGRLHLVYAKNVDQAGFPVSLYTRHSDDNGATWSAEISLDGGSAHANNTFARVGVTAYNGVVNAVYSVSDGSGGLAASDGLWQTRSADGGATWSATAKLFGLGAAQDPLRPTLDNDKGNVYLTFYRTDSASAGDPGDVYFSSSADGGATWTVPLQLTTTHACGRPTVSADNGELVLAYMRPFGPGVPSDIHYQRSADNGATWSGDTTLALHSGAASLTHPWATKVGKTVVITWGDVTAANGVSVTSRDGGVSWAAPQTWFAGSGILSRNTITQNTIHAAGYTTQIVAARLPILALLPDVTGPSLLDSCVGVNGGPPPTSNAAWSGPGVQTTGGAGQGLVTLGNMIARAATATFRQGDYWNSALADDNNECFIRVGQAPSANGEHMTVFARLSAPGGGADSGYNVDAFFTTAWSWNCIRRAAGVNTNLATGFATEALVAGDYLRIQVVGSEVLVWRYDSVGGSWRLLGSFLDTAPVAAGKLLGLEITGTGVQNAKADRFGGGVLQAPANSVAPAVSGSSGVGGTLSAAAGTWTNTPTRYGYQWRRDGVALVGATLPWYVSVAGDAGHTVDCLVTAQNSVGAASLASNGIAVGAVAANERIGYVPV